MKLVEPTFELEVKHKDIVKPSGEAIDMDYYHEKNLFLDIRHNGCNKILYDIIKNSPNTNIDIFDVYAISNSSLDKKELIGSAITLSKNDIVYIAEIDTVGYSDIVFEGEKNIKIHINDFSSFEEIYNKLMNEISEHFPNSELLDITENYDSYMDILKSFNSTTNNVVELEQDERDEI